MRVLIVTKVRSGGGTEKHVAEVAKALNLQTAYLEDGFWPLQREIEYGGYDIVHFFLPRPYVLGSLACWLTRFKGRRIYSRRAMASCHHPIMRFLEPLCHKRTDILVGNSPEVCNELKREAPDADIRLIRNGIDFKPLPHRDSGSFTVVCVANVWKHKHHEVLIQAVQLIADQLPDPWRLVLVGRGTEQFNNLPNVYGAGYRTDVAKYLQTADLFVAPGCAEGCPNAVLEAMTAGVPVIATDAGGNTDAVEHGFSGVLVPSRQPEKLASALLWAFKCPEQFKLMADNAKKLVEERFSMETCIKAYEELYGTI